MRAVGVKVLKNKLSEYIRLAASGETVLARALEPFPVAVRTLDALHLATVELMRARHQQLRVASYDHRFLSAAVALDIGVHPV